jgi:acyl-CoA thioesterase I
VRRWTAAAALGLALSGALAGAPGGALGGPLAWGQGASSVVDTCKAIAAASAVRHAAVAGVGPRVVVIGDSYSQGAHLSDPSSSWPSMLPGQVVVDGFAGSGFAAAASPCSGEAFGLRVARALTEHPALVVVQGGLNDYDVPDEELRSGVRDVLAQLTHRRAVLVGPPDAPSRASQVARVDALLAAEAARAGVPYVRTSGWQLPFLPDRLHLTLDGHRAFGDAVAARIAEITAGLDGLADDLT